MKTIQATGIILRKVKTKENDQMLTLFSQQLGKVYCIAKGGQKLVSKRVGQLDSLNIVRVVLTERNGFYFAKEVDLLSRLEGIKNDFEKRKTLLLVAEILEKLLPEGEQEEEVFSCLKELLVALDREPFTPEATYAYVARLLTILGYAQATEAVPSFSSLHLWLQQLAERDFVGFELE